MVYVSCCLDFYKDIDYVEHARVAQAEKNHRLMFPLRWKLNFLPERHPGGVQSMVAAEKNQTVFTEMKEGALC